MPPFPAFVTNPDLVVEIVALVEAGSHITTAFQRRGKDPSTWSKWQDRARAEGDDGGPYTEVVERIRAAAAGTVVKAERLLVLDIEEALNEKTRHTISERDRQNASQSAKWLLSKHASGVYAGQQKSTTVEVSAKRQQESAGPRSLSDAEHNALAEDYLGVRVHVEESEGDGAGDD